MTNPQEFYIACPQCNFSNKTIAPAKYKEVVYQPCNNIEDQEDHNIRDQIICDNCHNNFDFYWCAGHKIKGNIDEQRNPDDVIKWPQT